jgi:hypothetical protein
VNHEQTFLEASELASLQLFFYHSGIGKKIHAVSLESFNGKYSIMWIEKREREILTLAPLQHL